MHTFDSKWEASVSGNAHELRGLTEGRQSPYLVFVGGVDDWLDCPSDDFAVQSIYFANDDDASTVSQVGFELLSLFNGASRLYDPKTPKLRLDGLTYDGHRRPLDEQSAGGSLLRRPGLTDLQFEQALKDARAHDTRVFLLMLATEHEDVYHFLKYFDMSGDWVTYYKLLETVEVHAKKTGIDLGIVDADKTAFKNTANNFSLSRFDSRHGFKELVKQNKTPALTLDRAHTLVSKAVRTYISKRYGSFGLSKP